MSNNLRSLKRKQAAEGSEDIEALAAKARQERMEKCGLAVNKVLEDHNCTMAVYLKLGESHVPIQAVIAVPAVLMPVSR